MTTNETINHKEYRYRIIRVWGYGPWRRIKEIANIENKYTAEHTFWMMLYRASVTGKKIRLELYDREEKCTIYREWTH